ncbi:MAG TPA: SLATT domain-containing protein [Allosphingosinicella sp.]|nr:SLATT domain-containing protein [Allosphingosinicella sp.]
MDGQTVDRATGVAMLQAWSWRSRRALDGHYETARRLSRRHYWTGSLLVFLSIVVTVLSGRSLGARSQPLLDYALLVGSILALTLACLQVFLRDAERADQYRRVGARYSAAKRDIELSLVRLNSNASEVSLADIQAHRAALDRLGEDALPIPGRVWRTVDRKQQKEKHSFGKSEGANK